MHDLLDPKPPGVCRSGRPPLVVGGRPADLLCRCAVTCFRSDLGLTHWATAGAAWLARSGLGTYEPHLLSRWEAPGPRRGIPRCGLVFNGPIHGRQTPAPWAALTRCPPGASAVCAAWPRSQAPDLAAAWHELRPASEPQLVNVPHLTRTQPVVQARLVVLPLRLGILLLFTDIANGSAFVGQLLLDCEAPSSTPALR